LIFSKSPVKQSFSMFRVVLEYKVECQNCLCKLMAGKLLPSPQVMCLYVNLGRKG